MARNDPMRQDYNPYADTEKLIKERDNPQNEQPRHERRSRAKDEDPATSTVTPKPTTSEDKAAEDTSPPEQVYGAQYDAQTAAAMAGGPAATIERANQAAREEAQRQADMATRSAIQAGRSAGMMPGQAALGAQSQAAGAYGTGMQQGQQQYMGYTQLGGQLGAEMAQRGLTARGQDIAKYSAEQQAKAAQASQQKSWFDSIFGAVGGIASLFSDRNLKEDTQESSLADSLSKIKSYAYKYKGSDRPEAGIMAQDLERTAMAPAVMDTPEGKMIDTRRLSTMNTAALSEHEKRLKNIERMVAGFREVK